MVGVASAGLQPGENVVTTDADGPSTVGDYQYPISIDGQTRATNPSQVIPPGTRIRIFVPGGAGSGGDAVTGTGIVDQATTRAHYAAQDTNAANQTTNQNAQFYAGEAGANARHASGEAGANARAQAAAEVQREGIARQYEIDKQRLGLDTANSLFSQRMQAFNAQLAQSGQNFTQRATGAGMKMDILGMLADRSGPQDWVKYNTLLNGLSNAGGVTTHFDPMSILSGLVQEDSFGVPGEVSPGAGIGAGLAPQGGGGGGGIAGAIPGQFGSSVSAPGRPLGPMTAPQGGGQTMGGSGQGGGGAPPGAQDWQSWNTSGWFPDAPRGPVPQQQISYQALAPTETPWGLPQGYPPRMSGGGVAPGGMAITGDDPNGRENQELSIARGNQLIVIPIDQLPKAAEGGVFGEGWQQNYAPGYGAREDYRQPGAGAYAYDQWGQGDYDPTGGMGAMGAQKMGLPAPTPQIPIGSPAGGGYVQPGGGVAAPGRWAGPSEGPPGGKPADGFSAPGRPLGPMTAPVLQPAGGGGVASGPVPMVNQMAAPTGPGAALTTAPPQIPVGGQQQGTYGMPAGLEWTKYSPQELGNQPFIQKLLGNMPSREFGQFGANLNSPAYGLSNFPTNIPLQRWRDFLPSERDQATGLYQDAFGMDMRDLIEMARRATPGGAYRGAGGYAA